ncbi:MAG: SRPBCC family protein [Cyanobacteria bacterium J06638_20]
MQLHQTNDATLRTALTINGFFSAVSGLVCILKPARLADLLLQQPLSILRLSMPELIFGLGIGLLLFAVLVLLTARQKITNRQRVQFITALDGVWVLGSGVLLTAFAHYFSGLGMAIIMGIAIAVAFFAVGQLIGLALMYQGKNEITVVRQGARLKLTARTLTHATPETVWQIMNDQEGYAIVADNLSKVEIISGQGYGMVRQCTNNDGQSWRETCTRWDEGRAFAFRIDTEAKDYPYPIGALTGEWALIPKPDHTQICMTFNISAKAGLLNRLRLTLMIAPFAQVCDRLLNNWVALMEDSATSRPPLTTLKSSNF